MRDLGAGGARWLVTLLAGGAIALHLSYPQLPVDAVTVVLLVILILPWTAPLFESLEFPGGWKIKFQAVEAAAKKITDANPAPSPAVEQQARAALPAADPGLALVALRIEIEKRLRALASRYGVQEKQPLAGIVRELERSNALNSETASGLRDLIAAGNRAAHGDRVDPAIQEWVQGEGPRILAVLDALVGGPDATPAG